MGRCASMGNQLRQVQAAEKVNKKLHHCRDKKESTSDPTSRNICRAASGHNKTFNSQ